MENGVDFLTLMNNYFVTLCCPPVKQTKVLSMKKTVVNDASQNHPVGATMVTKHKESILTILLTLLVMGIVLINVSLTNSAPFEEGSSCPCVL